VAYVLDVDGKFRSRCNTEMVSLDSIDGQELLEVKGLVEQHAELAGSGFAQRLLADWNEGSKRFIRVLPNDYRRMLEAQAKMRAKGMSVDDAALAAFEENARSEARASGN
jgi:glutamate synthase (NADPH) large chain